jgi:hypothetical protein
MGAKTCKLTLSDLFSTIVPPFDKNDVARMKTTNDIERCVLSKIFASKDPQALGLIEDDDHNLRVS